MTIKRAALVAGLLAASVLGGCDRGGGAWCRCGCRDCVIRHTTAMHLLRSGVDMTVIALWLGHESLEHSNYAGQPPPNRTPPEPLSIIRYPAPAPIPRI